MGKHGHSIFNLVQTLMSIHQQTLLDYLDNCLEAKKIKDFCPNGLQVQGKQQINRLLTGVTACQALIDEAICQNADAILVHHGYFWKGEEQTIRGIKRERLKALLTHDINLYVYHLPLDVHPEFGNNIQLAKLLELHSIEPLNAEEPNMVGNIGLLAAPISGYDLSELIEEKLGRKPLYIGEEEDLIARIGWCTGAAQGYLQQAIDAGVDAFITGEINEPAVHLARETGTHFYSAGHHATERYGVKALGEHLAQEFDLDVCFVDIDNPV